MAKEFVKFGGPGLLPGYHTYYDKRNASGTFGGEIKASPGDVVAAAEIGGEMTLPDGRKVRGNDADHFVMRGMAEYVDAPAKATKQ